VEIGKCENDRTPERKDGGTGRLRDGGSGTPVFFDHDDEPVQILPRRGKILVARGKATKKRHPGQMNAGSSPSAVAYSKKKLDGSGRKASNVEIGKLGNVKMRGLRLLLLFYPVFTLFDLPDEIHFDLG
jgi:hypothetical protein